jgi:small GTP-binding protein
MRHYKDWKKKRHLRSIPKDVKNPPFSVLVSDKKDTAPKTTPKRSVKTTFDKTYKIIIIGNSEVGKHTILKNHAKEVISKPALNKELGIGFHTKLIVVEDKLYQLQIWRFKDFERFQMFFSTYGKSAVAAIFMFDITKIHSLQNYQKWFNSLRSMISNPNQFPVLLIGNKTDLEEQRQVSSQQAISIAKANKLNGYVEVSAKTGENVEEAFKTITRLIVTYSTLLIS